MSACLSSERSRGQSGRDAPRPNNLLRFLRTVSREATNVILGTATPIQLDAVELWDLLLALNQGAPQVLGSQVTRSTGALAATGDSTTNLVPFGLGFVLLGYGVQRSSKRFGAARID